jgi:hypothetical protein
VVEHEPTVAGPCWCRQHPHRAVHPVRRPTGRAGHRRAADHACRGLGRPAHGGVRWRLIRAGAG